MKNGILAVIPARCQSRRFPNKVLAPVAGKTLLQHVYEEASRSRLIERVVVATDSERILDTTQAFGGEAMMTSRRHKTGSDRAAEIMQKLGGKIIVNVQADHLGLGHVIYDRVLRKMLASPTIEFATLGHQVDSESLLDDPNQVKLVLGSDGWALWFSRFPLPYLQGVSGHRLKRFPFYGHIGVYFFRRSGLKKFHAWRQGSCEKAESLEQLRILENGHKIKVFKVRSRVLAIESAQDLKKAKGYIRKG
jgi:3-deoxy-manno-octulosonate cytidylyltransferase (CMP-KDO synthetase)